VRVCDATAACIAAFLVTSISSDTRAEELGAKLELHNRGKAPFLNQDVDKVVDTGLVVGKRGVSHFAPGSLAIFSVAKAALANEWIAEVHVGTRVTRLGPTDFVARDSRGYATLIVDGEGPLRVRLHPSVAAIRIEATSNPAPFTTQQIFGKAELVFLQDVGLDSRSRHLLLAIGSFIRYRVRDDAVDAAEMCTAFHIGKGHWITNAHCLEPALRCVTPQELHPLHVYTVSWLTGRSVEERLMPARLVAAGCSERDGPRPFIDYAVFHVPGSDTAASMSIFVDPGLINVSDALEVFQFWPGAEGIPLGRVVSRDDECRVDLLSGITASNGVECALRGFAHTCDTTDGSSGSPVVRRGGNTVVGLHYGYNGPSYNCAVGISEVISSIRRDFPHVLPELVPNNKERKP
jgi:hypothetical protein